MDTRETLLEGGSSGPAVKVGDSGRSLLIELVAGLDPDNIMPAKGKRLTERQISILRGWIDQGVTWDPNISFAKRDPENLLRTKPGLPDAPGAAHPIDRLLAPYYSKNGYSPPPVVSDRVFARRVYLDVVGLLPSPEELYSFSTNTAPSKRRDLVRALLSRADDYAQHWLTFWNDLLRNDYRGTGYIDGGRKQITPWLYSALQTNMPYDDFVTSLINPTTQSEGFIKGIVWRGVVNSSQTPQMQAAQNVSQVFMGVNLKCASCHDSFVNQWRLSDAYGLAAVFSDNPLEMFECDKPTGLTANPAFIYPELGAVDASADRSSRQIQLAKLMTGEKDGRLSRTMVNRLWAQFMGRGLVEPLDDMEQKAWSADVLNWLAEDFADHGYDLKRAMEMILTSQAYQLPAVDVQDREAAAYVFHGPLLRRLSAEQFRDAVAQLTGEWFSKSSVPGVTNNVRASLVPADPLAVAMGRPNREQVVTSRQTGATTLQALELTNGETLALLLKAGASRLAAEEASPEKLLAKVFEKALGREPSERETRVLLGDSPPDSATPEQFADLLWAVTMLPEFQLIY